jgi:predicted transcriptional regulator
LQASSTLQVLADAAQSHPNQTAFPVCAGHQLLGIIAVSSLGRIDPRLWPQTHVHELTETHSCKIYGDCDIAEALRLLRRQSGHQILLVVSRKDEFAGIVNRADILEAMHARVVHGGWSDNLLESLRLSEP